jgi:transcriptional regulator with XRE-family HTH domain
MPLSFRSLGFPARLRALLEAQGWEQIPFTEHVSAVTGLGMGQSRVSTLSRGKAEPSLQEVEALATALGVTAGWLAFEEGKAPAKLFAVTKAMPPERMERVPGPARKRAR